MILTVDRGPDEEIYFKYEILHVDKVILNFDHKNIVLHSNIELYTAQRDQKYISYVLI